MIKVLGFKLKNGQDILGRVVVADEVSGKYTIVMARELLTQPNQHGQLGVSMPPWSAIDMDGEITVSRDDMVVLFESVSPEIEKLYIEATSMIDISGS